MPRVQDAIPSLDCRAWKGRSNPLLLSTLRFAPESRESLGKDRSPRYCRHSLASAKYTSPPSRRSSRHWQTIAKAERCPSLATPPNRTYPPTSSTSNSKRLRLVSLAAPSRRSPPRLSERQAAFSHFGRIESAVPWMNALIFSRSSGFSLPVKSGMPRSASPLLNTILSRFAIKSAST